MIGLILGNWKAILAVVIVIAAFSAGVQVSTWKHDADALQATEQMEAKHIAELQEAAEVIGNEAEKQQRVRIEYRTIYKAARAITNGDCLDVDGVKLWRDSSQKATESEANESND